MALFDWQPWNLSATRRNRQRRAARIRAQRGGFAWDVLESRLAPAVSTWSGAVSNLWTDNGNWDVPPAAGNDLVFPAGAANLANTDDLPAGTSFASLTLAGSGYTLDGSAVALMGTLDSSQATGSNAVNLPLTASGTGPLAVAVDQSGAELVLGGAISGSGGLTLSGAGVLDLTGPNTYTGTTTVTGGVLDVDSAQPGSPVTLQAGTTLGGSGTVGTITSTSASVIPGNPAPGVLTDSGDLDLDSGSTFTVDLDGSTPGSGFSQLVVSGQVNLDNATLDATAGFTPTDNESFTIIDNTGNSAVSGGFAGLVQGATLTISGQPYTISYTGGDGNDVVLTSLVASTATVSASSNSIVTGQPVTLTATVGSGDVTDTNTPTGTVEFFSGSTALGTVNLSDGGATLPDVLLPVGSDSITAQYSGDSSFAPTTAPPIMVTVAQATTSTTLSVPTSSLVSGQDVTLTATVTPLSSGAGTPTGTVVFFSGANSLGTGTLDANGVATLDTTALTTADTTISATYAGDANFATSSAPAVTVTVAQAGTTTSVTAVPNPSTVGTSVTLTATVAAVSPGSGTPTGSVEFFNGSTELGTETLSGGIATLSTSALPQGSNSIVAVYEGDSNFTTSTSPAVTTTVDLASTTTLSASPSSFSSGQTITLTASVAAANASSTITPTGTVEFFNGATSLGSATLNGGVATLSSVSLTATSTLTATYEGDANYGGSTSPGVTVPELQASTTTVTTSPNPSVVGQPVTLAAAVASSSGVPTGTVMFLGGGIPLGTVELDSTGSALLTVTTLPAGSDAITVQYSGDASTAASTSAAVTQTVNQTGTTTTLTVAPLTSDSGQSVTLSVNVAAAGSGTTTPTGTVTFLNGSTTLGTATLDGNGNASLDTTALAVGTNAITAQYSGDSNFTASTSAAVTQTVNQATQSSTASTITVSASSTNPAAFTTVQFTANVASGGTDTATPTGTVVFFANGAAIGSATLDSSGTANFSTDSLAVGNATIVAIYQGDSNFSGSTSSPLALAVGTADETFVNQIYLMFLDRSADQAGLQAWTTDLQDGLSRQKVVRQIMDSPEAESLKQETVESTGGNPSTHFLNANASLQDKQQGINDLYQAILNRPADPVGLQFFVNVVNDGFHGKVIAVDLLGSDEYYSDITDAMQAQSQS